VGRVKLKLLKMKKVMFTAFAVGLSLTANFWAQVPSYVPTNGLVAAYTFTGNANNVFGNGTNGIVNNATLTTDRFGITNNAYEFNGINSNVDLGINPGINSIVNDFTISYWVNKTNNLYGTVVASYSSQNGSFWRFVSTFETDSLGSGFFVGGGAGTWQYSSTQSNPTNLNNWINVTIVRNNTNLRTYIDGILANSSNVSNSSINNPTSPFATTKIGYNFPSSNGSMYFKGKIDDLYFYNRALTEQEVFTLYNICQGTTITSQPSNSSVNIGSSAQFSVGSTVGGSFQWQSNPLNTGWLNLTNNSTYSGVTSNTLNVSNTTVSNHNQPFRAIVNTSGCIDTSDVAQIIIGDTCLTTVTDTLIINTTLSLPAPNNENTILIYPNPASDHITIDNGNFSAMAGYTIKIENNAGQQVFQSLINQAQFYVDLSTWSGNGLYFVHLIDAQGNTVTVRKIVLQ
jgi:hypothetical protein